MDVRMPFIPEETCRTQRVEIYLNDLKERLKGLRQQHDEVIQNSVDIIKEIDEMSTTLLPPETKSDESISKIKRLIQGFETAKETNSAKAPVAIGSKVNIQKIMQNFEQLSESEVLKDSLLLFKQAKESFEKIDTFLGNISTTQVKEGAITEAARAAFVSNDQQSSCAKDPNNNDDNNKNIMHNKESDDMYIKDNRNNIQCSRSSLQNKISMFNQNSSAKMRKESPSHYASCCSSVMSIDTFHSMEDLSNIANGGGPSTTNSLGYEGDNDDSEYDFLAMKKRKSKFFPENI